ncbi:putative ABC transporter ATP-binding protein [Caprobacter fermentans]|uniref:Putative ABC transporter ATP-binding protein n=1 Tax=Caproicibacter fermentans TaxID=2576756 RepID=A0A6N8I138_9FIRM|nr:ABC transporter ATP-binding protein [Caproicibacter fermentans]MVB11752.1 putative ABC transporter ATP-binding protein [Caproicibacter fermentans]
MILEVYNGCFEYTQGQPVLQNIAFHLDCGQIMAVMGRNGIGKTTLIKCIVGILKWNRGYSTVDGVRSQVGKPMKSVGYVPQAHKVSFSYSVRDMVVFGKVGHQSYLAAPGDSDYALADQILDKVGIYDLRNHSCNELSGGQLQLVFIARALINSPKLLVLDEPEAHLDFRNQIRLIKLIKNVVSDNNIACIINTHYPNHALRIADKCFLLGEQDYIEGRTLQIMTDDNIQKYFGVYSHAYQFRYKDENITAFTFLDEV